MFKEFIAKNIWTIVASLLISFFIWLTIAGQGVSYVDLEVPLAITGLPLNLAVEEELPKSIKVKVLANDVQGKFLLEDKKQNIVLNLSEARVGSNVFTVNISNLTFPRGVQLKSIEPENVIFNAYQLVNKIVKVEANLLGALSSDYELGEVMVKPESVAILGSMKELENLETVKSTPIDLSLLNKTEKIVALVEVSESLKHLTVTPRELEIIVNVLPKMHETEVTLPIEIVGSSAKYALNLSYNKVKVKVKWPLYAKLTKEALDIKATVKVNNRILEDGLNIKVPVEVKVENAEVEILAIDPPELDIKASLKVEEAEILVD